MEFLSTPEFWIAVGQIILIDILLGGDNAVVIALACRKLPPKQRTQGILWGTAGAIVLRIILIFFALTLLAIPFLKIVGALLLVWIGVKLLVPEHEDGHANIEGSDKLWGAVKTVIIADFVMSVDNVIAIAGAAEASGTGHGMALVIFGVLVSIPIIVWGSQLVIKLMDRYPVIITLRRHAAGLDRRHDDRDRPGAGQSGRDAEHAQDRGHRLRPLRRRRARCAAGAGDRQVHLCAAAATPPRPQLPPPRRRRPRASCAACCWRWTVPKPRRARRVRSSKCAADLADPDGAGTAPGVCAASGVRRRVVVRRQQDARRVLPGAERRGAGAGAPDARGRRRALSRHMRVSATRARPIAKEAADQGCDLIVMGTHGVGMTAALLGSVAQATLGRGQGAGAAGEVGGAAAR